MTSLFFFLFLRQDIFRATEIALNKIITTGLTAFVDHIPAISTTHAGVKDMNLSVCVHIIIITLRQIV